ncbi:MAG TPA: geranylgeranylglycerol-phosphate geranylgeranyltransferase [Crinalium sp.]|jgi:geranylgeranylglycerol-phosphate geranylgeranyltransferase
MVSIPSNVTDRISTLQALTQLFRLPVGILAALAGCATIYVINAATPLLDYVLTAITLVCMMSAACAINDYWDIDKDRIDHPERPLPSGRLSLSQAWWVAVILFGCALIAAIPLGLYLFILVFSCVLLLWNYSHLLLYSGILGNLIVATIIAALILMGSAVADRPLAMLYPTGFLFCYALAKEIIWDIHDAAGDRSQGIVTIANQWGDRTAFVTAWSLLGLVLLSIPMAVYCLPMAHPWLFTLCSLALLLSLGTALIQYQQRRDDIAYKQLVFWERISMVCGILSLLAIAPS